MHGIMHNEKVNKAYNRFLAFILFICFATFSFTSQLFIYSHSDNCHMNNHISNHSTMQNMCFFCDCDKKTNLLVRQHGAVNRGTSFLIDSLFLTMMFLYVFASLYGLHTPISLKTRMNN